MLLIFRFVVKFVVVENLVEVDGTGKNGESFAIYIKMVNSMKIVNHSSSFFF